MELPENLYDDAALVRRYLTADEEERRQLEALLEEKGLDGICRSLEDSAQLGKAFGEYGRYPAEEAYDRFMRGRRKEARSRFIRRGGLVAALCVLAMGSVFWFRHAGGGDPEDIGLAATEALAPGTHRAVLVLADGQEVVMAGGDSCDIRESGSLISYREGKLVYRTEQEEAAGACNELKVPRGGECCVTLEDGTKVWVNAESRLSYPVRFDASSRRVTLEGEAFFEVRPDSRPFVVSTGFGDVRVLGTAFGISAYGGGEEAYTTLVRGRVAVENGRGERLEIVPGEQAVASRDGSLSARKVDVMVYVGWKDGKFVFHGQDLASIMSTLERWYDLKVHFGDEGLKSMPYTGSLDRYREISSFFRALESTGDVKCRIEGREIYLTR